MGSYLSCLIHTKPPLSISFNDELWNTTGSTGSSWKKATVDLVSSNSSDFQVFVAREILIGIGIIESV